VRDVIEGIALGLVVCGDIFLVGVAMMVFILGGSDQLADLFLKGMVVVWVAGVVYAIARLTRRS
jgi:hypothetical protein